MAEEVEIIAARRRREDFIDATEEARVPGLNGDGVEVGDVA